MSRSGYTDDCDNWDLIRWRGQVASSIRGKRGQAFLREMLASMDALPEPKLVAMELEKEGAVCAIGSVGKARGVDLAKIDPEDYDAVAGKFGIAAPLAQEIVYMNDDAGMAGESDYRRFERMRSWIIKKLKGDL